MQEKALAPFRADGRFKNVRRTGTITALELEARDAGYLAGIGPKLLAFFATRNLLLRPLGNTIYVMPPYCVTQGDLDEIYAAIMEAASLK
jgi:adenosylmethionine-8-amino-7-oxononanoate aminotransferase